MEILRKNRSLCKSFLQWATFHVLFSTGKLVLHAQKITSDLNQLMETPRMWTMQVHTFSHLPCLFLPSSLCRCQWSVWLWACWVCSEEQHHPGMETALYSGRANPGDWLYHANTRARSEVNMGLFLFLQLVISTHSCFLKSSVEFPTGIWRLGRPISYPVAVQNN